MKFPPKCFFLGFLHIHQDISAPKAAWWAWQNCRFAIYVVLWPQIETPETISGLSIISYCDLPTEGTHQEWTTKAFIEHVVLETMAGIGAGVGLQSRDKRRRTSDYIRASLHCSILGILVHWLPFLIILLQTIEPVRPAVLYLRHNILLWQICQQVIAMWLLYSFLKQYLFIIQAWKLTKRNLSKELRHLNSMF